MYNLFVILILSKKRETLIEFKANIVELFYSELMISNRKLNNKTSEVLMWQNFVFCSPP